MSARYINCKYNRPYPHTLNTPTFDVFGSTEYGPQRTYHLPRSTYYSKWLQRKGFIVPTAGKRGTSNTYVDVRGNAKEANLNFPWILVTYTPNRMEQYHQTVESAEKDAPSFGHWQIINAFTGQIAYEPADFYQHSH